MITLGSSYRSGSPWAARFFCGLGFFLWTSHGAAAPEQPEAASGYSAKPPALGHRYMAVTANPHATAAAVEILELGGNAIDAAIAAQLVLNLVEPQSSGIGGGGFLLHWDAQRRSLNAYDGRETAPAKARAERFLGSDGRPARFQDVVANGQAVGVPGLLAMLELAYREHGRLRWERLFRPAIRLAENGFAVSPRLHRLLAVDAHLRRNPRARALYYDAAGEPLKTGASLRNPELANTLRRLASADSSLFYRGELGAAVADSVAGAGGDLTADDLAGYQARKRELLCGWYRSWRLCGMPPPSSGGLATLQLLGILERTPFDLQAPRSVLAEHYFAEAGRLAYADRTRYLGDPDFVAVPVGPLLAPEYLQARAGLIRSDTSMGQAAAGTFAHPRSGAADPAPELPATTHLSVVDVTGNAVALTSSIEDAFGSRLLVKGFFLNNQLTDFVFAPSEDGVPVANRVEPGKRPLSSMSPTMVFDREGNLHAVLGSPGGGRIINYVARTLVALLDWRLRPEASLSLPHVGSRNGPTEIERGEGGRALAVELEGLGHRVVLSDMTSGTHLIVRDGQRWVGAADPRREGMAAGE